MRLFGEEEEAAPRGLYDGSAELVINQAVVLGDYAKGVSISELARRYGVTRNTVKSFLEQQRAFDVRQRRYTAAEKRAVQRLREEKRWGPKRIAETTNIPETQVRFWLYGTRSGRGSAGRANAKSRARQSRGYYRMKANDWVSWRAGTVRSSLLRLVRAYGGNREAVPTTAELRTWIEASKVCAYCAVALDEGNFSVDHAQPVSRGGGHSLDNLRAACAHCNTSKGSMTESEFVGLGLLIAGWDDGGKHLLARLKNQGWQRRAA